MNDEDYKKDWIELFEDGLYDWEWDKFLAYYDPETKRYYWDHQSGCSCYDWEDPEYRGGWMDGDKEALIRARREWSSGYGLADTIALIRRFQPEKVGA